MTRRRGPPLDPEDRALWDRLAATVRPLHPPLPAALAPPAPAPTPDPAGAPPALAPFRIGERARAAATAQVVLAGTPSPPSLDRRRLARLARGVATPEARIDLHGMTLAEAGPALTRFLLRAQAEGHGLVLVITGKGRPPAGADADPVPERPGLLRRQLPLWLQTPPLAAAVTGIAEAHRRHGGTGAFYVSLRRR